MKFKNTKRNERNICPPCKKTIQPEDEIAIERLVNSGFKPSRVTQYMVHEKCAGVMQKAAG